MNKSKKVFSLLTVSLFVLSLSVSASAKEKKKHHEQPKLEFPVISDTQLTVGNETSHRKLEHALQDLYNINHNSDAMVINGDMINDGRAASYEKFRDILNQYPHPDKTFFTIGNHEFFKNDGNEASIGRFLDFTGLDKVYYEKNVKGYPFIFLGTESWGPVDSPTKDSAVLSDAQLNWLNQTLKERSKTKKPIFVFLHQPLPHTFYGTDIDYYKNAVIQDEELKNILSKYPQVIFFSGHMHWDLRFPGMFLQKDFTMVSSGAVYDTWGPDGNGYETVIDPEGSQGLYVKVYDDKVVIKGRDFTNNKWLKEYQHTVDTPK
ncbi:3',5'-cyclic AMP phosphodiesterase CpdA [Scopulibacillus darangshiensis]|uniref:3',5'-cyclic AMP phosphodiesterase CpdA n=1 Tax=Scopulibacillus darangshiensis TaxID=442528 RepID=A0A4R2NK48_9BACL|nr:metallophosphoesterase [Scopulibacillus darangshiensis]TCP21867.1 3',5'-cyclic AMP phosphodiesterase CpdA [Scopulibacillus darangshiensis]